MNIGQPGDGFTVISAMRRSQPEAVTLILTGFPDFDTALQALRSQVDDYLTKPADVKRLLSVINQNLQKPRRDAPLQVKRVSTLLRDNAKQIVDDWLAAVTKTKRFRECRSQRGNALVIFPRSWLNCRPLWIPGVFRQKSTPGRRLAHMAGNAANKATRRADRWRKRGTCTMWFLKHCKTTCYRSR